MACSLLRSLLHFVCPDWCVSEITNISLTELWQSGIRVLFVDLDNTLTAWGSREISEPVRRWIEEAKAQGFQVVIVSNAGFRGRVAQVAEALGIIGIAAAGKPRRYVFRRYLEWKGLTVQQAVMIGDQIFTDILAAKRLGMKAILVEPLTERRFITGRIQRPLELITLKLLRSMKLLP
ncbi:MAG: YqeG family HAD IIIA-type phosphatase [Armatimonadetes bacterium]|nr:YqeG family HAD IIIA-type phosphatase [Armatimonadota bacterium]MCX7966957.1 YqeG family HAD IIIA-type phosphatase [Armatimonadota bacterium]MDW8142960.1 YqeG family HAD IIIA-type phosphatase [Armatimonadota bacterium]